MKKRVCSLSPAIQRHANSRLRLGESPPTPSSTYSPNALDSSSDYPIISLSLIVQFVDEQRECFEAAESPLPYYHEHDDAYSEQYVSRKGCCCAQNSRRASQTERRGSEQMRENPRIERVIHGHIKVWMCIPHLQYATRHSSSNPTTPSIHTVLCMEWMDGLLLCSLLNDRCRKRMT